MARVKLRYIMGCPKLNSSYREKGLLPSVNNKLSSVKAVPLPLKTKLL